VSIRHASALFIAALSFLAPIAACSDGGGAKPSASPPPIAAYPVTLDGVTIAKQPLRIVSLSPTATEVLFAIGAGVQVVGVSTSSTFPEAAPTGDIDGQDPDLAVVASKKPDLIVTPTNIKGLGALGIPVIVHESAKSLDQAYEQIRQLGRATDRTAAADETIRAMKDGIDKIVTSTTKSNPALRYYFELDPAYTSVTSATFIGDLLGRLGLENIADKAPGGSGGHVQLSTEFIVAASPDLVLLADIKCCWQNAASASARSGWSNMKAVSNGAVVGLDDEIAATWGPRAASLLDTVAQATAKVTAAR
jgi:iron complex transport system substrate-binding protein